MNHFDYYSIKVLECSQEQLQEIIKKAKNNTCNFKRKRRLNNTIITYVYMNYDALSYIKTCLYIQNIPFVLSRVYARNTPKIHWVLNPEGKLFLNITLNAKDINWIQQEELYKLNQLLKITG